MQAPTGHRFCIVRTRAPRDRDEAAPQPAAEAHHSSLIALVIDCQVDDLGPALAFWSAALGRAVVNHDQDGDGRYGELGSAPDEVFVLVQRVEHEPRVHLDIQTDDPRPKSPAWKHWARCASDSSSAGG